MCSRSQRAPALGAIIILQAVEWCPQNPATAEFEGSPSNFSSLGGDLFHLHDRESLTRTTFLGAKQSDFDVGQCPNRRRSYLLKNQWAYSHEGEGRYTGVSNALHGRPVSNQCSSS
jgi:hypothetical protein